MIEKKRLTTLLAIAVSCMAILTGCGKDAQRQGLYFMIDVQTQEYPQPEGDKIGWKSMGRQFYIDEAVQICAEPKKGDAETTLDIYLCHEDGSYEPLLHDIAEEYRRGSLYLDQEKNMYYWSLGGLAKFDKDGNVIYSRTIKISDFCQMPDGKIMLLVSDEKGTKIAELDGDTGNISERNFQLEGWGYYLGYDANGPLLLNNEGFWSLNLADGNKDICVDFKELSYELGGMVEDFRMTEEGKADLLKFDIKESLEVVDISALRKIVVFRDWTIDSTIRTCAYDFNHESQEYYVVLEECDENTDIVDFRDRTGIDIVTGKGADIITSDALPDVWGYIQSGALEDLAPYIEKSDLQREDFFPATFSHWTCDGKIYGVDIRINPTAIWIDEELLGNREIPDVETLVAAMLNYRGDKKWAWNSSWILYYLLRGSEDMWGMIDRKNASCDFTGELFANMLKAAKLHGGTYAFEDRLANWVDTGFGFLDSREKLESEGKVYVGFLFDDGAHPLANEYGTMAINSKSKNKDGAWEFISYLLGEEVQKAASDVSGMVGGSCFPANKAAFNAAGTYMESEIARKHMSFTSNGITAKTEDILEPGRQEEIRAMLEDARFAPINNEDITSIILEEADAYFSDVKGIEEVCDVIQNRVNLYLGENQ